MTTPYTYLIGWPDQNKWYYGVRYANNCDPKELWITYKTSSKFVKEFVKLHGNPSVVEMNKARIGIKYEKIPCPYCNIDMPKNNYKRHIKICKNNLVSTTLL